MEVSEIIREGDGEEGEQALAADAQALEGGPRGAPGLQRGRRALGGAQGDGPRPRGRLGAAEVAI